MKRTGRERFCDRSGKVIHATRAKAAQSRRFGKGKGDIEAYHCQFCNGWHLGHAIRRAAPEPEVMHLERPS